MSLLTTIAIVNELELTRLGLADQLNRANDENSKDFASINIGLFG